MLARLSLPLALCFALPLAGLRAQTIVPVRAGPPTNHIAPVPVTQHAPASASPLPTDSVPFDASNSRFWVRADYLFSWLDSGHVPLLVTTSTPGTPAGQAGIEGRSSTRVLFGDHGGGGDTRPGLLFRAGYQFPERERGGFEFGLIAIGRVGEGFTAVSNGDQILARPFFDVSANVPSAELIAAPGVQSGSIRVRTASDLIGTEVNYRAPLDCVFGSGTGIDLLLGYRSMRYRDKLTIDQTTRSLDPSTPVARPQARDAFYTRNMFNGAQFGLAGRFDQGDFFFDGRITSAVGQRHAHYDITGSTTVTIQNEPARTVRGGVLALPTNIGSGADQDTGFVGEIGLQVGYRVSGNLSVTFGYTFLYFANIVRANELVDRNVNPTQIPPGTLAGPARPAVIVDDNDIWAQAVSLGVEWRY